MKTLLNLLRANARRGEFRAEGNTLYVYDAIVASEADAEFFGGVSAEAVVKKMATMSGPVTLRINSPGGDVFAARAVVAAMNAHDGEITAYVDGYAASAASVITAAADKVVMAQGAFLMIHKAWTVTVGNADDHMDTASLLEKIDGSIADSYAARSGKDASHYALLMAAETWFTASEAVAEGLADEVADKPVQASAHWDLSAYKAAPVVDTAPAIEPEPEPAPAPVVAADELARRQRIHAVRTRLTI